MNELDLRARARAFRADDPDPDTQAELDALLAQYDEHALRDRFGQRLTFGTAGLRGLIGAGDNRMNRRVVALTSAALCAQLRAAVPDAARRGLCIGFDGRHKSREFAEEVRAIANGAGFVVHAFETPAPTPLLAYAVLQRRAAGGVMITASHNPAAYNGYKVYWENGAQLNSPHDRAIAQTAAQIDADGAVLDWPRLPLTAARERGLWFTLAGLDRVYLDDLQAQLAPSAGAMPSVAYTALHGVGESLARAALSGAGVTELSSVTEQAQPDPDFPTVRFPNPEEDGALDLVLALAQRNHAQLVIANDPDADRLAVAARTCTGALQTLTGNELGVLLCDYLLERAPRDGKNSIITTIVSTPLAAKVAQAHGARAEITLTGFKWIVARALELEREGYRNVLGFEEALGYNIGALVRDKDGVAAAAHVARMVSAYAADGGTLHSALERIYRQHGCHESEQRSFPVSSAAVRTELTQRIQALRDQPPTQLAGLAVTSYRDLLLPSALPASDVLIYELAHAHRVIIRPSGTEPKLKLYLDCSAPLADSDELAALRTRLRQLIDRVATDVRARLGL